MASLAVNSLMHNLAKNDYITPLLPKIDRGSHYSSGPSESYHHSHSSSSSGGGKKSIALSALTLLAFLFFLHILQSCLQEHMDEMNPQQVMIMQAMQSRIKASREEQAEKRKGDTQTDFANSTTTEFMKESRHGGFQPKTPKTTHVKLKTYESTSKQP